MNPHLEALHAYPFERLARLKADITPPARLTHIAMSIGEPQHTPPAFLLEALRRHLDRLGSYPATAGLPELRAACAGWLTRRYGLSAGSVDADTMVLPVNGTREALFAFVQAAVDGARAPLVAMPNPFYQIYEGAALLAGARPFLLDTTEANDYLPELAAVPAAVWRRCQVLFLCSPGNPTGAVLPLSLLQQALSLADRYDFLIAADECYADIYLEEDAPPAGLLQAAQAAGRARFERCVVFHSLSKRFTRELFARENLTVLPGSYLGRTGVAGNPGAGRVRISLVPEVARCVEAAQRLREFLQTHWLAPGAGTSA